MVKLLLAGAVIVEAIAILYLLNRRYQLKKEYKHLYKKYKDIKENTPIPQEQQAKSEEPVDKLATHDRIIEMHQSGLDEEKISDKLKIPRSKVNMTLKFDKMKKDGTQ